MVTKGFSLASCALILTLVASAAQAGPMTYSITLTGTIGGSGTFDWDGATSISNFTLVLDAYGPFAGGPNDGAPTSYGPNVFDGSAFLNQISVLYAPYFDLRINPDGTWFDTDGRIDGAYSVAAMSVPEPGTLSLVAAGLLVLMITPLFRSTRQVSARSIGYRP